MLDVRPEPRPKTRTEPADDRPPAVLLAVKAVPGARRDEIVGPLGDRLKVRVSAPPEGGRANKAICRLIAGALGVKPAAVTVHAGATHAEKVLRIEGVEPRTVHARWP